MPPALGLSYPTFISVVLMNSSYKLHLFGETLFRLNLYTICSHCPSSSSTWQSDLNRISCTCSPTSTFVLRTEPRSGCLPSPHCQLLSMGLFAVLLVCIFRVSLSATPSLLSHQHGSKQRIGTLAGCFRFAYCRERFAAATSHKLDSRLMA